MAQTVKTRFLILSDTRGDESLGGMKPTMPVDVAIHCGDMKEVPKLSDLRPSIRLLKNINAPLKLVIAENYDSTFDILMFKKKIAEVEQRPLETDLVEPEYDAFAFGEAMWLFKERQRQESLTIYASSFTLSEDDVYFELEIDESQHWNIAKGVNVVITRGPPRGILDYGKSRTRIGWPGLFAAVARAKPLMHCFGQARRSWGGRLVTWRNPMPKSPSHFTAIDNERSASIETLAGLRAQEDDTEEVVREKGERLRQYKEAGCCATGHCQGDEHPVVRGKQTLFVNAAMQGSEEGLGSEEDPVHFNIPWHQ
ncbi:hypothetical protein ACJ41O_005434 [Fusarium nematophilum]